MPDRSSPHPPADPAGVTAPSSPPPATRDGDALRRLRSIVDGWPDIVACFDRELRHVYVNRAVEAVTGRPAADFVGCTNEELGLPAHLCAMWGERLRRVFETGREDAFEFEMATAAGVRHYLARVAPEPVPAGSADPPPMVIGVVRDVTDRVRLEAQLRQAQKMEAVGQLAGGIAHDFNNLLTVITTYSHFLLDAIPEGDERRADVAEIRRAADRASRLTRQLLAFSRRQVLRPRVVDLNTVVAAVEPLLHRLGGDDVEVVVRLGSPLPPVLADPGQLEQAVLDLAGNAADAMPDGGVLMIETLGADDGTVQLVVRDTGAGMDAATRARATEPFFTTKPKGSGTGLGLSTVDGIVQQSGGRLRIDSLPGRGTRVSVILPALPGPAAPRSVAPPSPAARGDGTASRVGGSETVLVVEDEESVRASVRRALEEGGYTVLEGSNGTEGVERARAHDGRIHLLLTDVVMPGLSGQEVAEQLVSDRPELRVMYMSGYSDDAVARRGELGTNARLLQKPFSLAELADAVRAVLDTDGRSGTPR